MSYPDKLFVYSSLRKGFHNNLFDYITRYFYFISPATTKGILAVHNNLPVAIPCAKGSTIKGELYQLTNPLAFSYVFGQLDDYEGLDIEEGETPRYRRETTNVILEDGSETTAWIYWFNPSANDLQIITSEILPHP